jgi:hypothetical protein
MQVYPMCAQIEEIEEHIKAVGLDPQVMWGGR